MVQGLVVSRSPAGRSKGKCDLHQCLWAGRKSLRSGGASLFEEVPGEQS